MMRFDNRSRPHSALGGQTPDQVYFNQPTPSQAAA
ncbi:MAG: transposase [Nitrospira sp. SB0677_bin_15]|nr:transposase [Nitrospira sp. SB0667_bin_9]MYD30743.1 transposase [Nitrospira sp. SB0661_bin_20]MYG39234.1 transposase [Nitrospira sp. SB0677_bin_15]MYH01225.1 transposase [Nitrospira sp. SB0675_bin_23]